MAFLLLGTNLEGLRASRRYSLPNTYALALSIEVKASQFRYSPHVLIYGSRGKVKNTTGASQNAEAAKEGQIWSPKHLKGLHS